MIRAGTWTGGRAGGIGDRATSGIGAAIALAFARRGARVVLTGRREREGTAIADRIGAVFVAADLTDPAAPARLVAAALDRFGRLDCLVNNAGIPATRWRSPTSTWPTSTEPSPCTCGLRWH
ncbi:hypothetical protein GCM10018954_081120 [Kutzneria kofuensis]